MEPTVFETHRPAARIVDASLADTTLGVYWIEDVAHTAGSYPRLSANTTVDDAVVGGGYAGLWAAIKLKQEHPERRVALIEAVKVGWAASGRNGGFCEASITHGEANAEARWPDEAEDLHRIGLANLDAIERFIAEHELDVDWERTGQLSVANHAHQVDWVGESSDPQTQVLGEAEVRARVNSPTFLAGGFSPRSNANVHPAKLAVALALAKHATSIGVEIYEGTPVERSPAGKTNRSSSKPLADT